jgi:tRNA uridine 5-carbamoylmethylation protein Kti12
MDIQSRITIFTGYFGSGKTELAINAALQMRTHYEKVAICDLDVINPYYRTRDVSELLQNKDIKLLAPSTRLTAADLPIVPAELFAYINALDYKLIIDAGGDKDGVKALGQFYNSLKDQEIDMIFVINTKRPEVNTVNGILESIASIEKVSRMKITSLINNTNILSETTEEDIKFGIEIAQEVSKKLNINFNGTTILDELNLNIENLGHVYKIKRFMKSPWEA